MRLNDLDPRDVKVDDRRGTFLKQLWNIQDEADVIEKEHEDAKKALPDWLDIFLSKHYRSKYNSEIIPQVQRYNQDSYKDRQRSNAGVMEVLRSLYQPGPYKRPTFK